jgi:energy-coupling factor transporter ATP-binding protein EcfA2
MGDGELRLEYRRLGRDGTVVLTAWLGGETLAVEELCIAKSRHRLGFVDALCERCPGLDRQVLEADLLRLAAAVVSEGEQAQPKPTDALEVAREALERTPKETVEQAKALLASENLLYEVLNAVELLGVAGERETSLLLYLAVTSRLLKRPLYVLLLGPSSSGKSYLAQTVCKLCPPEAYLEVTDATANALYYLSEPLSHKVLLLGERKRQARPEEVDTTKALRELVEAQQISKLLPIKVGDRLETVRLHLCGPAAVIETCSHDLVSDEDRNRAVLCFTTETQEQTREVLRMTARQYVTPGTEKAGEVVALHQTAQRLLQPVEVAIPFAAQLAELFPAEKVESRRAFSRVLRVTETLALLRQYQPDRTKDPDGRLLATLDDYAVARAVLRAWADVELGAGLPDAAIRLWERAREHGRVFTRRDAEAWTGCSWRTVHRWLSALVNAGLLARHGGGPGKAAEYETTGATPDSLTVLPDPEELAAPSNGAYHP